MNTKQKLGYMLAGSAMTIAALIIGMSLAPVTAQNERFGDITCTSLTVIGVNGDKKVSVESHNNTGRIRVGGKDGKEGVMIGVTADGGKVTVYDDFAASDTLGAAGGSATLTIDEHGGVVGVLGNKGESMAVLHIDENGGRVEARGDKGESVASLGIGEHGGGFVARGNKGESVVVELGIDEQQGGTVAVRGNKGEGIVLLSINEHGGAVSVGGNKGEGMVILGFDEYGGTVMVGENKGKSMVILGIDEQGGRVDVSDKEGVVKHLD